MKKRWSAIGVLGIVVVACGGERFNDVGDLNGGGKGGKGGAESSGSGAGASGSAGAAGGSEAGGGKGGSGAGKGGSGGKGGADGDGGTGIPGPGPDPDGGAAGMGTDPPPIPTDGPCDEGTGCYFQEGSEITALAADSTHLYWTEYGTFDGVYQHDGRLLARAFGSEEVQVLASGLSAPNRIGITSTHFYLNLVRYSPGKNDLGVVRVPREGGDVEVVFSGTYYGDFASNGDTAYLQVEKSIYSMAAADTAPTLVVDGTYMETTDDIDGGGASCSISVANGYLYYTSWTTEDLGPPPEFRRLTLAGGAPEILATSTPTPGCVRVSNETAYVLDQSEFPDAEHCLMSKPVIGGAWTRLPPCHQGSGVKIQFAGDAYFHDRGPAYWKEDEPNPYHVIQRDLTNTSWSTELLTIPDTSMIEDWVGTDHAVYWATEDQIFKRLKDVP